MCQTVQWRVTSESSKINWNSYNYRKINYCISRNNINFVFAGVTNEIIIDWSIKVFNCITKNLKLNRALWKMSMMNRRIWLTERLRSCYGGYFFLFNIYWNTQWFSKKEKKLRPVHSRCFHIFQFAYFEMKGNIFDKFSKNIYFFVKLFNEKWLMVPNCCLIHILLSIISGYINIRKDGRAKFRCLK